MTKTYRTWLKQLTALPTAAGREDRVIAWVRAWAKQRRDVVLGADKFGNLTLRRRGLNAKSPIYFTAHMDHPAFVVVEVLDDRRVVAEFRGGVSDSYFEGSPVTLHPGKGRPRHGNVLALRPATEAHANKRATIEFPTRVKASPGDVLTWTTGPQRIEGDLFYTPACDDLSGVAAAFSSFDALLADDTKRDIRLLLTRAEEVGFIGAIAACKAGTIPRNARLIALENSKSFAESPIGGGPIVRVGDATSTFDPDLTYRCGKIAQQIAAADPAFKFQRKLMPGGTCEASAYQTYGYTATCLCLPLGNYHNMNEATGKIDSEFISLSDYDGLVRLLVEIGRRLDEPKLAPPLRERLDDLFANRRGVLEPLSQRLRARERVASLRAG